MVQELVRALKGWPQNDKRTVALALVKQLSVSELAEVLAAAHQRIHAEAAKRNKSRNVASRPSK